MACFTPIAVMIERTMADGSAGLLLAPDLAAALSDAARADAAGHWTAQRLVLGRDVVLEGEALSQAIREAALRLPA